MAVAEVLRGAWKGVKLFNPYTEAKVEDVSSFQYTIIVPF